MSFKNLRSYVENYFGKREALFKSYDESPKEDLELTKAVVSTRDYLLESDPEFKKLVEEILWKSHKYQLYLYDKNEREAFSKLTHLEKQLLTLLPKYLKFKTYFKFSVDYVLYPIRKLIYSYKATKQVPIEIKEEPVLSQSDYELLQLLDKQGKLNFEKPIEATVTIEANIEQHATGKIASKVLRRPVKFDEGVKIKSYVIVPGKVVEPFEAEDLYNPQSGQANFTREGERPVEGYGDLQKYVRVEADEHLR